MSGSGASNLGYGNIFPFSNINGNYVNTYSTNNPANFGSNEVPGLPGLSGAKNNVDAAAGIVPGICNFKGGAKKMKRKIKNITKKYKMRHSKRRISSMKRKIRNKYASKKQRGGLVPMLLRNVYKKYKSRKNKKGGSGFVPPGPPGIPYPPGYSQYQNNMPLTQTYSVGGVLSATESALANPPPFKVLNGGRRTRRRHRGGANCVDNYNHYTNMGFPSRGH